MGVFFGIASSAVALKIGTRLYVRRRLFPDDCFLIIGLAFLCGAAALIWMVVRPLYALGSLAQDPHTILPSDVIAILHRGPYVLNLYLAFLTLTWSTLFAVKFSFLSLFRLLIRSKCLTRYYWIAVGLCIVSWMFCSFESLILCHFYSTPSGELFYLYNEVDVLITR